MWRLLVSGSVDHGLVGGAGQMSGEVLEALGRHIHRPDREAVVFTILTKPGRSPPQRRQPATADMMADRRQRALVKFAGQTWLGGCLKTFPRVPALPSPRTAHHAPYSGAYSAWPSRAVAGIGTASEYGLSWPEAVADPSLKPPIRRGRRGARENIISERKGTFFVCGYRLITGEWNVRFPVRPAESAGWFRKHARRHIVHSANRQYAKQSKRIRRRLSSSDFRGPRTVFCGVRGSV